MLNRRQFLHTSSALVAGLSFPNVFTRTKGQTFTGGVVFHDRNGSGKAAGQPGIAGVCVSNGREVVKTDRQGKWTLPVSDDCIFFVIKPAGWAVTTNDDGLPQFHYVHKPNGSPKTRYEGVAPTGSLPSSIDFGLTKEANEDKFRMILFGDPQPRDQKEIDYIAHDVAEQVAREVAASNAKFGLSLGDEMFDVLSLYGSLNGVVGSAGVPWYNTVGNHDLNYDSPTNEKSTETFQRVFGPPYYAFNYGKVHFIVLNDVFWKGSATPGYHAELTADQLEFVKNDLAHVPKDRLIAIAMHIPLVQITNREALYRLIEDRPHTVSFSAHTHVQRHYFLGASDGWKGQKAHHHLNHATVCGSWWQGAPDERGIPHATMSDGGPNGYSVIEFDGADYKVTFRPASRPEWEQMAIYLPESIKFGEDPQLVVNVFAGSERSTVEWSLDGQGWRTMRAFMGKDPGVVAIKAIEAGPTPPPGRKIPNPSDTPHLWKAFIAALPVGHHTIHVRTTDMFGQMYAERRILRVEPA